MNIAHLLATPFHEDLNLFECRSSPKNANNPNANNPLALSLIHDLSKNAPSLLSLCARVIVQIKTATAPLPEDIAEKALSSVLTATICLDQASPILFQEAKRISLNNLKAPLLQEQLKKAIARWPIEKIFIDVLEIGDEDLFNLEKEEDKKAIGENLNQILQLAHVNPSLFFYFNALTPKIFPYLEEIAIDCLLEKGQIAGKSLKISFLTSSLPHSTQKMREAGKALIEDRGAKLTLREEFSTKPTIEIALQSFLLYLSQMPAALQMTKIHSFLQFFPSLLQDSQLLNRTVRIAKNLYLIEMIPAFAAYLILRELYSESSIEKKQEAVHVYMAAIGSGSLRIYNEQLTSSQTAALLGEFIQREQIDLIMEAILGSAHNKRQRKWRSNPHAFLVSFMRHILLSEKQEKIQAAAPLFWDYILFNPRASYETSPMGTSLQNFVGLMLDQPFSHKKLSPKAMQWLLEKLPLSRVYENRELEEKLFLVSYTLKNGFRRHEIDHERRLSFKVDLFHHYIRYTLQQKEKN